MTYRASPRDGVAWVTGASSGIGRSVALELARRGYSVVVTARRRADLEELAALATGFPGRISVAEGDVTDEARMAAIVAGIEAEHGPIALAFFNAGVAPYVKAGRLDISAYTQSLAVNVMGVVNGLSPVLAAMAGRRRGQVAVTASVAGYGGLPRAAAYGASKAAAIYLCEALKLDCDNLGINLQVVNPGFVETPLTAKNEFPMPFLVTEDAAAKRICDGFERDGFEIVFPRRLAWILKVLNLLPYPLYFWLVSRGTGWHKVPPAELGADISS